MKDIFPFYSIEHFVNQVSGPTEFAITLFEEMEEPEVDEVHKHAFYEILWVDEGSSSHVVDFQEYELQCKSLFFISPGQLHEFECWKKLKGGTIMFTEDFFLHNQANRDMLFELSFLDNVYFNPSLVMECKDFSIFRNYIELLVAEKKRPLPNSEILQALLHILLLQVQRSLEAQGTVQLPKRNIVLYKKFKNLLEKHFAEGLTPGEYANKLNITQHHLNRIVKEISNKTTTDLIKSRTILEAKRLLSFSEYSVSEIASSLNYFDSSYFSKIFKAETGKTPMNFKKEMSERYRRK